MYKIFLHENKCDFNIVTQLTGNQVKERIQANSYKKFLVTTLHRMWKKPIYEYDFVSRFDGNDFSISYYGTESKSIFTCVPILIGRLDNIDGDTVVHMYGKERYRGKRMARMQFIQALLYYVLYLSGFSWGVAMFVLSIHLLQYKMVCWREAKLNKLEGVLRELLN